MAKGSDPAVRWKDFTDVPRICFVCKRTLKLEDVGEYRNVWTYNGSRATMETVLWCAEHRGGRKAA